MDRKGWIAVIACVLYIAFQWWWNIKHPRRQRLQAAAPVPADAGPAPPSTPASPAPPGDARFSDSCC